MVDLTKKPFYLSESDISWVEKTIRSMSPEEKIGQLFIMLDRKKDREETKKIFSRFHIGGSDRIAEAIGYFFNDQRAFVPAFFIGAVFVVVFAHGERQGERVGQPACGAAALMIYHDHH